MGLATEPYLRSLQLSPSTDAQFLNGAKTFSCMTLDRTTLNILTNDSRLTSSTITLSRMTLTRMTLTRMILARMTLTRMTLTRMELIRMTLIRMEFIRMTLSDTQGNDYIQQNDTQCSVVSYVAFSTVLQSHSL